MHTTGPWTIGGTSNPKAVGPIVNTLKPGGTTIYPVCIVCGDTQESRDNARLIAAAPELLELLEMLSDLCGSTEVDHVSHDEDYSRCCQPGEDFGCLICRARHLVSKAKGD
jgi:hypothetical protein